MVLVCFGVDWCFVLAVSRFSGCDVLVGFLLYFGCGSRVAYTIVLGILLIFVISFNDY